MVLMEPKLLLGIQRAFSDKDGLLRSDNFGIYAVHKGLHHAPGFLRDPVHGAPKFCESTFSLGNTEHILQFFTAEETGSIEMLVTKATTYRDLRLCQGEYRVHSPVLYS